MQISVISPASRYTNAGSMSHLRNTEGDLRKEQKEFCRSHVQLITRTSRAFMSMFASAGVVFGKCLYRGKCTNLSHDVGEKTMGDNIIVVIPDVALITTVQLVT